MTALIQKRMVALNRGARALVDLQTKDLMQIVVAEIMTDKIYLDATGNLKAVHDDSPLVDKLDRLLAADGGPGIDDL
jgi:DNA-directed RNA polymerase subunit omega